jgi:hypothetical protein
MGYDYYLRTEPKDKCEHCGRETPAMQLEDSGMTWNHNWAFFEIFGKEGFRSTVYHRPLTDVITDLELVLEYMQNSGDNGDPVTDWKLNYKTPGKQEYIELVNNYTKKIEPIKNDGWCQTVGNAYYFINELLEMCQKHVGEHPDATWYGD